jgi:hypothetical protein
MASSKPKVSNRALSKVPPLPWKQRFFSQHEIGLRIAKLSIACISFDSKAASCA